MHGGWAQGPRERAERQAGFIPGTREEMGSPATVAADSAGADPAFFSFGDGVGWGAGVGWVEDEDDEFIPLTGHVDDGEGQEHDGDE